MRYRFLPALAVTLLVALLPLAAKAANLPDAPPVIHAETDGFEVVGRLETRGLVLHIDQFATNEPVLDARLTVESGGQTGEARLEPETGTYVVDTATLLAWWQTPGDHEISFTLITPKESDLLLGKLSIQDPSLIGAWSDHLPNAATALLILGGLALLACAYRQIQRRLPGQKRGQA